MNRLNQNTLIQKVKLYMIIIYIVWVTTPYLNRNISKSYLIAYIVFYSIISILTVIREKVKVVDLKLIILIIFWLVWQVFYKVVGLSSAEWGNYLEIILFYFPIFIMMTIHRQLDDKHKAKIVGVYTVVLLLNIISNIMLSLKYQYANTLVDTYEGEFYRTLNVGGIQFITVVTFFASACFVHLLYAKKVLKKVLYSVVIILSYYYVINITGRATLSIFLLLQNALIYLNYMKYKKKGSYVKILQISITAFFLMVFSVTFINYLPEVANARLLDRIQSIYDVLGINLNVGNSSSSSFSYRSILISNSIKTFMSNLKNFLFGSGLHYFATLDEQFAAGLGLHSVIIDTLTVYGIFGFSIFVLLLLEYYGYIKYILNNFSCYKQVKIIYIAFFIYCFFNTAINASTGILFFIILPLKPNIDDDKVTVKNSRTYLGIER